jgi:hypothetical protein
MDFERAQGKFDTTSRKTARTEKERVQFARSESDAAIAKQVSDPRPHSFDLSHLDRSDAPQEYDLSDERLRTNLPPLIAAAFSLLPEFLNAQIMIQNSLLGHYYTQLHNYCEDEGFPSPPPPMSEIIAVWQSDFQALQQQVETGFSCIAGGKTVRQPFKQEPAQSSLRPSNGAGRLGGRGLSPKPAVSPARSDSSIPPSPNLSTKPGLPAEADYSTRKASVPSQGSLALSMPNYDATPSPGDNLTAHAPAGPRGDYFSRDRNPTAQLAAAAAQKKRPPPPPPKRKDTSQGTWVTALYDFAGQGRGDLAFREGDRIKVIKKTDSTDDWWEGELGGVRGPFPANYCQA